MCGLTGIFDLHQTWEPDPLRAAVARMTDTLIHRGPDDHELWLDAAAGISLGFRRLAIVDLSDQGRQPMQSDDGRYVITFNGEIYNFEELRSELKAMSAGDGDRPYRGRSDTEVLLRAFQTWGVHDATRRLVGMFAFALWDGHTRTLHLARDRFGEKPLYYGRVGNSLVFASELKAIVACPRFSAEIDRDALVAFLKYGYISAPRSIYRGILKLQPGTILSISSSSAAAQIEPVPYWSAKEAAERGLAEPFEGSDEDALAELDTLLRQAVRNEMVADVPLGAFLSGGTDSSLIVAMMAELSPRRVRTFTIGFRDDQYNEAEHARAVARHLQTEHTELYVTPAEALAVIPRLPALYDEPFADPSQIPTYLVAKLARQHVTVSVSGDGGDEVFAGYAWYRRASRIWSHLAWAPARVRRVVAGAMAAVSVPAWDRAVGLGRGLLPDSAFRFVTGDKLHKLAALVATARGPESVYEAMISRWNGDCPVLGASRRDHANDDPERWNGRAGDVERLMYRDVMRYLPDDILAKVDRATMAVSLESRALLLDHRIYELAWRLPMSMKMRDGRGKWPLRQLLYRRVPRELVDRPKMGFCVPMEHWLRGELRDWASDLLDERRIRRNGLLDARAVQSKLREHVSGARNWHHQLWNLLMFESWLASR